MKSEKKADPRITKAIKDGQRVKNAANAAAAKKRADEAEKEKRRIASYSKQADEWVEKKLFKLIAKAERENSTRVELHSSDPYIPTEALIKAVKKIEGLTVESVWVQDWNDPDCGLIEAAHYDYYVKWKSDPYEGYPY
jgi:hypothetical protein